ncbi:MAG: hypothetical protein ACRCYO_06340 [Bacteroidia bacterium]
MELKYKGFLSKFDHCPAANFSGVSMLAFRWVHAQTHENDFKPLWLIQHPPAKALDDSDKMCSGFGLSLYTDEAKAKKHYKAVLAVKPPKLQVKFRKDKGDCIAHLRLHKADGVAGDFNAETSHFDFHESIDTDLNVRIIKRINIFEDVA